jgi:hypothetical protein
MPGTRPYFEFDHEGERKTIEADTWVLEGGTLTFYRYAILEGGAREEQAVASYTDVDPRSINKVIP